jgi:hypothetical protein
VVAILVGTSPFARGEDHAGSGSGSDAAEQGRDQIRIAIQDICPVSGNKLGEHGEPVKVAIGQQKEEVFLCCKGCASGTIDPKHWATIHANFAKAQQICPVMKHKLPKNPKWTIVQGQVIYVCCPPCTKKIAASPDAYLQAIDQLYAASLNIQSTRR